MTQEELDDLRASKEIYRELLRGLNVEISGIKLKLNNALTRFDEINKEYEKIDRAIAMETKIIRVPMRGAPKQRELTPDEASSLLLLIGAIGKQEQEQEITDEEDPDPYDDELELPAEG